MKSYTVGDLISVLENLDKENVLIVFNEGELCWELGVDVLRVGVDSSDYVKIVSNVNNCLDKEDRVGVGKEVVFLLSDSIEGRTGLFECKED